MKHDEAELQAKVVDYLRGKWCVVISIPNERNLGIADAKRMQSMGLTKGAPDLLVWDMTGKPYWFELKTQTGKRTLEQHCFEHLANQLNITYKVVRSLNDVKELI